MIVDATDLIVGRLATKVAKAALLGEKVDIINSENSIITGNKKRLIEKFKTLRERGVPSKGPFIPRMPDMLLKRMIRGMLPYKQTRGRDALNRILCHMGVPEKLKGQKAETFEDANVSKIPNLKYLQLKKICKSMGAKI